MPVVFRHRGYTAFFFSNEGNPREPVHVHVRAHGALAKFWVDPAVQLAENYGFDAAELREIERIVRDNVQQIARAWSDHFGS